MFFLVIVVVMLVGAVHSILVGMERDSREQERIKERKKIEYMDRID